MTLHGIPPSAREALVDALDGIVPGTLAPCRINVVARPGAPLVVVSSGDYVQSIQALAAAMVVMLFQAQAPGPIPDAERPFFPEGHP